jgi:hypothetical protein
MMLMRLRWARWDAVAFDRFALLFTWGYEYPEGDDWCSRLCLESGWFVGWLIAMPSVRTCFTSSSSSDANACRSARESSRDFPAFLFL